MIATARTMILMGALAAYVGACSNTTFEGVSAASGEKKKETSGDEDDTDQKNGSQTESGDIETDENENVKDGGQEGEAEAGGEIGENGGEAGGDVLEEDGILTTSCDVGADNGPVNFETLPGGSPAPLAAVAEQYKEKFGISFKLADGTNPVLADVGGSYEAYECSDCGTDGVQPDQVAKIGTYFLTDDGVKGSAKGLVVTYTKPTLEASGDLLDVDGSEAWQIQGFDKDGQSVAQTTVTASGDGRAKRWSLTVDKAKAMVKITLTPSGTSSNFGLGFDNFAPGKACP